MVGALEVIVTGIADAGAAKPTDIATAIVVAARTADFNLFVFKGKPFSKFALLRH
jgi:hypothetical protein